MIHIQMCEKAMIYTQALRFTDSKGAQELQNNLVRLKKYVFYGRYGDILANVCTHVKLDALKRQVEGWQTLEKKPWPNIDLNLQAEKPEFEKLQMPQMSSTGDPHKCPTHMAIHTACQGLGFKSEDMFEYINQYASRNRLMHSELTVLVKEDRWDELKTMLYSDLSNLLTGLAPEENVAAGILAKLLKTIIKE